MEQEHMSKNENTENVERTEIHPIAHIHTDFPAKFGIPRQSGLVEELEGLIVMEPAYRSPEAFRGMEGFSHLWLIWQFSENIREGWSPTVRPPRLGGNVRMGVFATRSPFRPNALGLSCVRLLGLEQDDRLGPCLRVAGADLMDGTPIFDIKPYHPWQTATRRRGAASRRSTRTILWRWTFRSPGSSRCRKRSGKPCGASWRRIPGLRTNGTAAGSMA